MQQTNLATQFTRISFIFVPDTGVNEMTIRRSISSSN